MAAAAVSGPPVASAVGDHGDALAAIKGESGHNHPVRPLTGPGVLAKSVAGSAMLWDSIRRS